jgi:hypothetical protein
MPCCGTCWFIGQKIGRADEHVQYRRLFKDDVDFHPADRPPDQRDNWLVGKEWYERGVESVNRDPKRLGRKSPRIYFSSPAMSQINYSEAIEEEGFFDTARRAWLKAADEWRQFGQLPIEHSTGVTLKLGEKTRLEKEVAELRTELDGMLPGVRGKLLEEKRAALTPDERALLDTPAEKLTSDQANKLYEVQAKIEVTDRDVADRVAREQPDNAKRALNWPASCGRARCNCIRRLPADSNYDFWENCTTLSRRPTPSMAERHTMPQAFLAADLSEKRRMAFKGGW